MAKLPRVTSKIFASNAAEGDIGQFGSALTGTKVPTDDISIIQALPAYETGWRGAVVSDRNYPTLQEMNGLQKTFSQQIAYILQNGMPEWDAGTTYYTDQFCRVGSMFYVSLQDENTGNNPTSTTGYWEIWNPTEGTYANTDLSNLSSTGEKHFLNKNQITNCILSAPNGVATFSGNTITVKQGLKVLIPNGRNADGSLKNIEYTLQNDVSQAVNIYDGIININASGAVGWIQYDNYFEGLDANKPSVLPAIGEYIYYATDTNLMYFSSSSTITAEWNIIQIANIGLYYGTDTTITSLTPDQPVELAKQQDIDGMWIYKPMYLIKTNTSFTSEQERKYDLSDYLPNDGCLYEVILTVSVVTGDTSGDGINLLTYSDFIPTAINLCRAITRTDSAALTSGNAITLIGTGRWVSLVASVGSSGTNYVDSAQLKAYRKVR